MIKDNASRQPASRKIDLNKDIPRDSYPKKFFFTKRDDPVESLEETKRPVFAWQYERMKENYENNEGESNDDTQEHPIKLVQKPPKDRKVEVVQISLET